MKPFRLLAAGVSPVLLTALLLLGSACIVDSGDPIDDIDDTAETDDMLHGTPPDHMGPDHRGARGDGHGTEDEQDDHVDEMDEWSDERDQQHIVIPGQMVSEPEPDPWDDPMKNGQDSSGSGNKD